MPSDEMDVGRFVDREFFWGVAFTKIPHWAHEYMR